MAFLKKFVSTLSVNQPVNEKVRVARKELVETPRFSSPKSSRYVFPHDVYKCLEGRVRDQIRYGPWRSRHFVVLRLVSCTD